MRPSFYLHVPFCRHLCNYCDFYKMKWKSERVLQEKQIQRFQNQLLQQASLLKNFWPKSSSKKLETIYLGGGTPSLWGESGALFFRQLLEQLELSSKEVIEWSLECDPDAYTIEGLEAWKSIGVDRLSVGLQAGDDDQLKVADRSHRMKDFEQLAANAKSMGLSLSVDLLLGLPRFRSTPKRMLEAELERVLQTSPHHLSVYLLDVKKSYPFKEYLPNDAELEREYLLVNQLLSKKGFEAYEVSSYALPGHEAVHNQRYLRHAPMIALGTSATGLFYPNSEANPVRYRWNGTGAPEFEPLSDEELRLERFYLAMRGQSWVSISHHFPQPSRSLQKVLEQAAIRGLLELDREHARFRVMPQGRIILDSLVGDLLEFLEG